MALSEEVLLSLSGSQIFGSKIFKQIKDPCLVFDGKLWHMYGTGVAQGGFKVFHSMSDSLVGDWQEKKPCVVAGIEGGGVCAPGVVHDGSIFHMFMQTEYDKPGGKIEHLISGNGEVFNYCDTAIVSLADSERACVYDAQPFEVDGHKFISYSGSRTPGSPDIFLAESAGAGWSGPWETRAKILSHEEVSHHNQRGSSDYEWGLEGSQVIRLTPEIFLLNAVCFLPSGEPGTRQRVFFAVSRNLTGPYKSIGPIYVSEYADSIRDFGENGHASVVIHDETLYLYHQLRGKGEFNHWQYGLVKVALQDVVSVAENKLSRGCSDVQQKIVR